MKNNQLADTFIRKADECWSEKRYAEALENYNQSLCYAGNKSQVISDAFAGRSKVYFETEQFEECLDNIQLAIETSYSDEKCNKFNVFYEKCLKKIREIASNSDSPSFFTLTQPKHPKIPFIADCLEVRENDIYGRYIVTTRDLGPGDIVVIEEPFYKVLDPSQGHTRCAVCLKQNRLNLFPCTICSNAMFCSKKCSDSLVHRKECNETSESSFDKLLLQRMVYQAVEIAGSLEELKKLMESQTSTKTIMDFDFSDELELMNEKNKILATTSLAEREPWSTEAYAKYESVTKQLQTDSKDERDFLRNFVVRCLKSMTVNFFHFFWSTKQAEGQGLALCSLAAYFAHSCDPNVDKVDVDNKFAFVIKKPIKQGEQLFMNYDRYSFLTHSLEQRQEYFDRIYTFQCACNACSNDYPLLDNLPKIDQRFVLPEVNNLSRSSLTEQYNKNCKYIKDNIDNYPCAEICSLMVQNYDLLHAIGNNFLFELP